ncbi:NAD(P)H-hydrate epimerase [Microbacter sp. GSS18]|nr:NAD(P)H-hydrate epimerase [Microbacter sp. GSS18]
MTETPAYTAAQVRAAEQPLLEAGEPLMARASSALAQIAREEADAATARILVLAGSGNNGGDALFAAAQLAEEHSVDVLVIGTRAHEHGVAAAVAAGARWVDLAAVRDGVGDYDLVLDGILGIGSTGSTALRGVAREAVKTLLPAVGAGRPRVIAVDLPSGLHPDTGECDHAVLPASVTVTFGAVKTGLVRGRGAELAGDIVLVDIGLTPQLESVEPELTATIARIVEPPA